MYISKLHLQGFKSFLHKTDLEFGEGVTAVVGPNGCGKSNIVDAIRWVLGEQKMSLLRSARMEDIIFNGTKNKQPISFCEASMLIHNNMGVLPIEYNDVEISRRLYRSGESEFYINKTLCRLKDIQNLFVDTGMSSNAYSVIELKMIDTILSNNAADRRQMFEEAAGINNYKQQRQATLRKMKATEADMERINDIMLEVSKTLKNLELQRKRYERYEKLTLKHKMLTIQNARAEIQYIQEKQLPIEEKLDKLKNVQSTLSGQMNIDETLTEVVKKSFEDNKIKLNKSQGEITALENKLSTINSNVLIWSEKILGNDNQAQHFNDELQHSESNRNLVNKKVSELIDRKNILEPEFDKRKDDYKSHERKYRKISSVFDKCQIDQELFKKETESNFLKIKEEEGSHDGIKNRFTEKIEYKESLNLKVTSLNEKLDNIIAGSNLIRLDVEKHEKNNAALSEELSILKSNHSELEENILSLKGKCISLQARKTALQSQVAFYNSIIANHDGFPEGIKNILSNHDEYPDVIGVLSELLVVDEPYQAGVEVALGEYNDFLVVKSRKNAEKLIADSSHRLSIFALDSIPKVLSTQEGYPATSLLSLVKYKKELKGLLKILIGDVCVLEDEEKKPDIKSLDTWKWVSKSGRYYCRGFIHKSTGTDSQSIIGRKQKLELLKMEYDKLSKEIIKADKKLENTINTADSSYGKLKKKSEELETGIQNLNASDQKMSHQELMSAHQQKQLMDIKQELQTADSKLIDLDIQLKISNEAIELYRIEYEKSTKTYDDFTKQISDKRKLRNNEQEKLQKSRIRLLEIEKEEEGLNQRLEILMTQEKEFEERIKKYHSEILRIDNENKSLHKSIAQGKQETKELKHSLESINSERDELDKDYNKSYDELQGLQSGIRERQKQKEEYLSKIREYEITISDSANEIKHHRSRIKELYNEDLIDEPVNLEDNNLSMQKVEIEKIQRSLYNIGPVNLAVNDEYEKETERYNFLDDQYTDLEESEKIIEETISKLDGEAKTKFMDTFQKVQENFTKTYSTFFDGGEGYLRLVGEEDLLEAEIEIIAQPPGKKNQTLRMLSAGEKALTAIALLFAIYLVKPSPFCILDEVDAPLDDTNIGKFAKALQDFSDKTQFIVVTHNKLTMETADFMYGITQQEEGVSKIVSVKLKEKGIEKAVA